MQLMAHWLAASTAADLPLLLETLHPRVAHVRKCGLFTPLAGRKHPRLQLFGRCWQRARLLAVGLRLDGPYGRCWQRERLLTQLTLHAGVLPVQRDMSAHTQSGQYEHGFGACNREPSSNSVPWLLQQGLQQQGLQQQQQLHGQRNTDLRQCVRLGRQVQEEGICSMTHSSVTLAFTHAAQQMQQPKPGSRASCTHGTSCKSNAGQWCTAMSCSFVPDCPG